MAKNLGVRTNTPEFQQWRRNIVAANPSFFHCEYLEECKKAQLNPSENIDYNGLIPDRGERMLAQVFWGNSETNTFIAAQRQGKEPRTKGSKQRRRRDSNLLPPSDNDRYTQSTSTPASTEIPQGGKRRSL